MAPTPITPPEPEYAYQAYPKMIYHPDRESTTVADKEELDLHIAVGWSTTPVEHSEIQALGIKIDRMEKELGKLKKQMSALEAEEEDKPAITRPPSHHKKKA